MDEYWIVDWMSQHVEVHRRQTGPLTLVATLDAQAALTSPLLPDFRCPVAELFFARPA